MERAAAARTTAAREAGSSKGKVVARQTPRPRATPVAATTAKPTAKKPR
jgi:hypothetical protein